MTTVAGVAVQVFTTSTNYIPTSGMIYCVIHCIGGGGGGGANNSVGTVSCFGGAGGGGGGYSIKVATSGTIGASQTVTIGSGGAAGAAGLNNGSGGGTTSVGVSTICRANGGSGGGATDGTGGSTIGVGGAGGSTTNAVGDVTIPGGPGANGLYFAPSNRYVFANCGGNSGGGFGQGGTAPNNNLFVGGTLTPNAGQNYGGGGSGSLTVFSTVSSSGAAGASGAVFILEFLSA